MDVSPDTKLNNNRSVHNYKSFRALDGTITKGFTINIWKVCDQDADLSHLPKQFPLRNLASGSPDLADNSPSYFKETDKDPLAGGQRECVPWKDGIAPIYAASIIFSVVVTFALVLQMCLGESPVSTKGVLVTDHKYCTELGQKVLHDRGSSVDAAIAATLCLGVVHPHTSGIGGGGVMLVHDIREKETRVINFQETAPSAIKEMLQHDLELKPGLQVGVPGMLRGLHQAHELYGRLSWNEVVTRAADVARNGFNVSHSLAEAIVKVKSESISRRFRDTFFPWDHDVHPGSFLTMPSLAVVLGAGLSDFYSGNLSQEMADEVRANGGVLSRADISNYSAEIGQPVEGFYHGFKVQVPPPPSAGAALISALKLLEGFYLDKNSTANGSYHWIAESLKAAQIMASGLGDPRLDSSIPEMLSEMLSKTHAEVPHWLIKSSRSSALESYTVDSLQDEPLAGQVVVMGSDDLIVTVASSLGRPFGSRIITPSGILLNSHILQFSWPNKTQEPLHMKQRNWLQPGKRPLSFLMPTIVLPSWDKCGTYMALSSPDGDHSLSAITQVLINALPSYEGVNDTLSLRRFHYSEFRVDSELPEEADQEVRGGGQTVQSLGVLPLVRGIQRKKDIIKAMAEPPSFDSF